MRNNNQETFLKILQAGLWKETGANHNLDLEGKVDWEEVYQLAEEQSVIGVCLAGIEHSTIKPPQELLLQWIGEVQLLEQQNKAMNKFIAELIEKLRKEDIYTILVKGQGVAQCYERPLWRASGDVDLLLNKGEYDKAKAYLLPLASKVEIENKKAWHLGLTIQNWEVELHGSMRSCCLRRMDKVIDEVQESIFYGGNVRLWDNKETVIFLPSPDDDVFLVFSHIIKHFFREGIGLRQICDLCRLLWKYKDSLNVNLLKKRLKAAGIMTEWYSFASYAAGYLGMPVESIPLYSANGRWKENAKRINGIIMYVGNFGHNRDFTYLFEEPFIVRKTISFCRRTTDFTKRLLIFPVDSMRVWIRVVINGVRALGNIYRV